jgi:HEAT repeat protein
MGKVNPEEEREIERLVELLRTDRDEDTRSQAAQSLGKLTPATRQPSKP